MPISGRRKSGDPEDVTDQTIFAAPVTGTDSLAISEREETKTVTPRLVRIVSEAICVV